MTPVPTTRPGFTGPASSPLLRTGLSIRIDDAQDTVVLHLQGELDMGTADQFRDAVSTAMATHASTIVVDVTALHFVDSTGVSAFTAAWRRAMRDGQTMCLRHPTRLVGKVLRITGVDRILLEDP